MSNDVVVLKVDGSIEVAKSSPRAVIGGWVEICEPPSPVEGSGVVAYCDEEGMRKGLRPNPWNPHVLGTIVLVADSPSEKFSPCDLQKILEELEYFILTLPFSLEE